MLRDVEREARLADAGPRGQDDQVALLEAGGQRVQVREAGPDAADLAAMRVQVVEPVIGGVEEGVQLAEAGLDPALADAEQLALGPVDRLLDLGRILVADPAILPAAAIRLRRTALRSTIRAYWTAFTAVGVRLMRLVRYDRPPMGRAGPSRSSASATVTMSTGSRRSNSSSIAA